MKKIIFKSKAIQGVILIVAAMLLLSLWPFRSWQEEVVTSVAPQTGTMSDVVSNENTILQTIVAQYDHLNTIRVYLGEDSAGESFYLRILDEKWQQVCEQETVIDQALLPGYHDVMIDIDTEVGKMYYIILQGKDSEFFVGCEFVPLTDTPYLGEMYYSDSTMEGMSLVADYCYGVPLRKGKVLLVGGLIALLAATLCLVTRLYYKKREDKLITVEKVCKYTLNPLVGVGAAVCLVTIFMGLWSKQLLDNSVFVVSVALLAGILFYTINHNRDGQKELVTIDYLKSHIGDIFQSVAIAGAVAACCEYLSGLYDIHHYVAERKEMIWFALAVIAMFKFKEIVNWYNAVYLVIAGVLGYRYYQSNLTPEMDELNVQVLKYTVWVAILLGLIVIRTVIGLCKKKLARPAYLYSGLLIVFFVLMNVYRNGRTWPIVMAVSFVLFYLNYGMWEHKERFLVNVARGVVMQFIWSTGYCLLHRPYVSYRNARYTHIFHTVTITATYLTMVECVAVVLLFAKFLKSRKLKDCFKELLFFGVVSSYMIFTMARTAFLAVGVMGIFAVLVLSSGKGKEKVVTILKNIGWMALSVLICLPVTFTVQRTVPALVSEPHLYEIEYSMYCPEDVMRGRQLNTHNFMRVGRFIDVFADRIFGIPEGTFDIYGEIEAYEREHGDDEEVRIKGVVSSVLVASAAYLPEGASEQEEDYTNGRLDIFKAYFEQLNMTGHEKMGATLENGEIAVHAHNIYLQVAYDHGIIVGIVFILVGIVSFVISCLYYRKKKETITYASLPMVVIVAVAAAGVAEWIFHYSNVCGFMLMLVITPFLFKNEG